MPMAEESVKDTASEDSFTTRPRSSNILPVELSNFIEGEEEIDDDPTSSSVTGEVLEQTAQHPHLRAPNVSSQLGTLSLAQSSMPNSAVQAPAFKIQFTTSTGENYSGLSQMTASNHGDIDLAQTEEAPEQLLTPEDEGRDELRHRHCDGRVRSESGQRVSNQAVTDTVTCGVDSLSSAAVSSPIAAPSNGRSAHTPVALSSTAQSSSKELGVSPYVIVKGGLVEVYQFESPGLLYARSTKERHNLDTLQPADEVAEDVLDTIDGDVSHKLNWEEDEEEGEVGGEGEGDRGEGGGGRRGTESYRKSHSVESGGQHEDLHLDLDVSLSSLESSRAIPPLDPNVLRDLEKQAREVASNLEYIMDNLHNSLHAMTVCAKQSVMLHRESVNNLHAVVDTNVKATYSFLAKFEELNRQTVPLNDLAQQIKDVDETLKVLERNFRTP